MTLPNTHEWQAYINIYFPDIKKKKKKERQEAEVMHSWFRINFRAKSGIQGIPQPALSLADDSSPIRIAG